MKRFIAIILSLVILSAAFCGCDETVKKPKTMSSAEESVKNTADLTSSEEDKLTESKPTESKPEEKEPDESKPDDYTDPDGNLDDFEVYDPYVHEKDNIGNLSKETVRKIKDVYLQKLKSNGDKSAKLINIYISKYYGTLSDGSVVVSFVRTGLYKLDVDTIVYPMVFLNDYLCYSSATPYIFKNNKLEALENAYKNGTISTKVLDEFFSKYKGIDVSDQFFNKKDNCAGLTKLDIIRIKQSYHYEVGRNKYKMSDLVIKEYYGNLKDNWELVVLGIDGVTSKNVTEKVGKYNYTHPENQGLYVYYKSDKNTSSYSSAIGEIKSVYSRDELISDSKVPKNVWKDMFAYYSDMFEESEIKEAIKPNLTSGNFNFPKLSEKEKQEILAERGEIDKNAELEVKQAYVDLWGKKGKHFTIDDVTICKYYGTYRGAVVVILIGAPEEYTDEIMSHKVNGIEFIYTSSNYFVVYRHNAFYNLEEALNERILHPKDLEKIHDVNMAIH